MSEPPDETRDSTDRHTGDLESGQVNLLYEQIPTNLLATGLVGLLLTFALWDSVPNPTLAFWFLAVLAVAAGRWLTLRQYRARGGQAGGVARWKLRFLVGVALNGILWGVAGASFFVPESPVLQTLLAFSLAGLGAGSVTTLASVRGAPLLFLVPALVPYTFRLFTYSGETSLVMAAMVALFMTMMSIISRRLYATVEKSLQLRFENVDLIQDLTRARDVQDEAHRALTAQVEETAKAQAALLESHEELERRVYARTRELEEVAVQLKMTVADLDSESRAADEARREAESASNAKSQFLAVVSHELRTPLNAVVGFQDLLAAEVAGPLGEKQQHYLSRANLAAQQLISLIDQILNLARIESGKEEIRVEKTDVSDLAREVAVLVEPLAAKKALQFRVVVPHHQAHIRTDSGKVRQILLNLLSNAIKFTAEGEVELRASEADGAVTFAVHDTGPGIPPQDLDRIFEPFTRSGPNLTVVPGGTGLGLSVSRGLAELMGGSVTVESTVAEGSVFTLHLPAGQWD